MTTSKRLGTNTTFKSILRGLDNRLSHQVVSNVFLSEIKGRSGSFGDVTDLKFESRTRTLISEGP